MIRTALCVIFVIGLAGCQTAGQQGLLIADQQIDPVCARNKLGARLLAKVTGFGLGAVGVPGGGIVARGVGYAADPRCQIVMPQSDVSERARPGSAAVPILRH